MFNAESFCEYSKEQELPVQYIVQLSPSLLAHSSWLTQLPIKFLSKYFFSSEMYRLTQSNLA